TPRSGRGCMARIRNRRELRDQFDAAEARRREDETEETEEEEEDDDEEEEEAGEEGGEEAGEEGGEEPEAEDEEEAPPKKKKKPAKEPKPKRVRTPKHVRMRVIWGVYNNSNQCVHKFPYPQRKEADDYAAKMKSESKTNQTYFVQPIKEPIEEK